MKSVRINQIKNHSDEIVMLNGWVYNSRRSGKIGFLTLRDGFGLAQCIIVKDEIGDELFENFKRLTQESSLTVIGKVVKNDRAIAFTRNADIEFSKILEKDSYSRNLINLLTLKNTISLM